MDSAATCGCAQVLTDHLQSVDVDVAPHHAPFGVQLGPAQAHRHADLPVSVAAHRQAALAFQTAGGPPGGGA